MRGCRERGRGLSFTTFSLLHLLFLRKLAQIQPNDKQTYTGLLESMSIRNKNTLTHVIVSERTYTLEYTFNFSSLFSSSFNMRIFHTCKIKNLHKLSHYQLLPPSFHDLLHVGPLRTIYDLLHTFTLWPDAWTLVGDVWQLSFLGHCRHVIVMMLK